MPSRPDYFNDKHTFRHHLQPESNESLDVGTNDRRFDRGRFRQLICDTLLLNGASLTLPITAANGGTGIDTSASTGLPRVSAGTWTIQALTNGQLLIGSTGVVPVAASLTAGAGITITPGAGTITIENTAAVHAILSATHTDSLAAAVTRGALIVGNLTPAWASFALGAAGTFLKGGALDPSWAGIALDTDTISGTLATALGGTNADFSATVQGNIIYFSGAGVMSALGPGTVGQILRTGGASANPSWSTLPFLPGGRLTLTSGSPVMTANVAGSTSIYYAFYKHNQILLYDGTNWIPTVFTELTNTTTDATKNPAAVGISSNYDLFVWNDAGTIRLGRGPAWTSDTGRGAGAGTPELVRVNGTWLNANAITNGPGAQRGTYVGTVRSNSSSTIDWHVGAIGVGGTASTLMVWNAYSRIQVAASSGDSTDTWTYQTQTWRASNSSNGMRCSFIRGLDEDSMRGGFHQTAVAGAASGPIIGIGLDSTTAFSGHPAYSSAASVSMDLAAAYASLPGLGLHFLQAIENVTSVTNAVTYYGDGGEPARIQNQLLVEGLF